MEGQGYRYDAFISYRHLPLDKAVAVRLQELLEGFKPPKELGAGRKIQRIFRDQSELPTSGDLGADIHEALMSSRYLIVICTEKLKESIWCMEEIRQFKEAHNGQTGHILVVTASGEPDEVLPEALLFERYPVTKEDGTTLWQERMVEPLCCDVRADSIQKSLKRLKTEFLRVAAPLIGCRYDDLYQRHRRRRRRQRILLTGGAFTLLTGVLAVVSVFAYRTYLSEKNYRQTLAETYTRQGTGWMEEGKLQEALLYHTSALMLEPETQEAAKLGAALLLEQNAWPCFVREEPGAILEDTVCLSPPDGDLLALDRSGTRYLIRLADGYEIWADGEPVGTVPEGMGTFLRSSVKGDGWVFCGDDHIFFYRTSDGDIRAIPRPTKVQAACQADTLSDPMPTALPVAGGQAVAVYGGYVYLYDLEENALKEKACVDLAPIFAQERQEDYLDAEGRLWVSEDGSLAVVASGFGIAAFNTADLSLKTSCLRYHYFLDHVAISRDGAYFALVYGNPFGVSNTDPGGYLEVFDRYGEQILETPVDPETPYEGAVFDQADPGRLLAWSRNSLHFWDVAAGKEYAVPLKKEGIACAAFGEDVHCILDDGEGMLYAYDLLAFTAAGTGDGGGQPDGTASASGQSDDPAVSAGQPDDPAVSAGQPADRADAAGQPDDPANAAGQPDGTSLSAQPLTIDGYAQALALPDGLAAARSYTRVYLLDTEPAKGAGEPAILDELRLDTPVNGMMAPAGGQEVYLFARWESSLYRVDISADGKSFAAITRLDTRGQVMTQLYPLQDGIAAVTGTGQVLFYRPDSQSPERTLQLEHSGTVLDLKETGDQCLAVRIRWAESTLDSYRFDTSEITELWDLASGIHIADLDPDISADTESLAYKSIPAPDPETLAFLAGLTCCTFDDAQNILSKTPAPDLSARGNWGSILRAETFSGHRAGDDLSNRPQDSFTDRLQGSLSDHAGTGPADGSAAQAQDRLDGHAGAGGDDAAPLGAGDGSAAKNASPSLEDLTAAQEALAADTDPEEWLAETDKIWKRLKGHAIAFSITELDTWFRLYWHNAQKLGCLDKIGEGISIYLALSLENELQDKISYGKFDGYLLELMAETKDHDPLIAAGFLEATYRLEQAEPSPDEMLQAVRQYEACYLRTYGRLLTGNGDGSGIFAETEELRKKGLLAAEDSQLKVLEQLVKGDGERAASYAQADIQESLDLDVDPYMLEFTWKYSLLGQYALVKRKIIQPEVFDRYIRSLPAHMGLEIIEASPQALDAGLRLDDLILAADDRYIGCLIQAQELFAPDGTLHLAILRDGEVIDLEMDPRTKFSARFRIRFIEP